MEALFKQLLIDDSISKVALLGSGCSSATETTADISHYFNITQVRNLLHCYIVDQYLVTCCK